MPATIFSIPSKTSRGACALPCLGIFLLSLAIVVAFGQQAVAGSLKKESAPLAIAKFTTGVVAAYALHEMGHLAAARLTNTDIEFGAGRYNQPIGFTEHAENDTAGVILHASGLVTQTLVSEVILQTDSIDKNDTFVQGMMFWNIVNPIIYALDYWVLRRTNQETDTSYQGDIEGVENYSDESSANAFAAIMALVAAYQGYRYIQTQTWAPDWMQSEVVQLNCQSINSQGVLLTVNFRF
jgi:hypothetical protein